MTPWDDALHRRNGTNKLGQEKAAAADEFWPTTSKWRGRLGTTAIKAGRATRHHRHASSAAKCNAECRLPGIQGHRCLWSHAGLGKPRGSYDKLSLRGAAEELPS